jgi:hypothetical protein
VFEQIKQLRTKYGEAAPIKRVEWIAAILLSAVVLFLLILRGTHAGALWRDDRYAWSEQLGAFFQRHALRVDMVAPRDKSVSEQENVLLLAAEGWRD